MQLDFKKKACTFAVIKEQTETTMEGYPPTYFLGPCLLLTLSLRGTSETQWAWFLSRYLLLPGTSDTNPTVSEDALFRDKLKHMGKCKSCSLSQALLRQAP